MVAWKKIEKKWKQGEIGSSECLSKQFSLLNAKPSEIYKVLSEIEIDLTFIKFVKYCQEKNFEIVIVSEGLEIIIQKVFERFKLSKYNLKIIANGLNYDAINKKYNLITKNQNLNCCVNSAVCKCSQIKKDNENFNILIGNGKSDFNVAKKVNLVFARDELIKYCKQKKITNFAFLNFNDIIELFKKHNSIQEMVDDLRISDGKSKQ